MDFNGSHLLFPPDVFLIGDLQLLVHHRFRFIRRGNHPVKFSHILNASHQTAKQETVPQGLQSLSLAGSSLEAAISLSEEHGWKTVRYGIFFH